jgi:hypothetical protein
MKHVTFREYREAKLAIIDGVEYVKNSSLENGKIKNTYTTEGKGAFYEMLVSDNCIEFWSDSRPERRRCDELPTLEEKGLWPAYGELLADAIRANTLDFSQIGDFEKFVLDNGHKYRTENELQAGYDRAWKSKHDILITEAEFMLEAGPRYDAEILKVVYDVLVNLAKQEKIKPGEVYRYAHYGLCLCNPEAIIAYETSSNGRDEWCVNVCDMEATIEEAIVKVNRKWGFEASRINVIGIPYYSASDDQFIRFDCAGVSWLWANDDLYWVYAD